ncbi:hypothetical protein [Rheinheimera sp. 4Y26]|uniref:hypothetical protein n=1 Tax=Rheinheimera sp. 4Y26 TaxID=2977811 RepID=UPI0021B0DB6C|nr:hypothetical protein [Rheinheimera sp. 4Y26]MCT6699978.1 hypothetical protein [Rheinheimera sp. 4Y26]
MLACGIYPVAAAAQSTEFCDVLRAFVGSVKPDETRQLVFRTSWGANFKDTPGAVLFAKRCEHGDYPAAKNVCSYLMEHASAEFAAVAVKKAIVCLSPASNLDEQLTINSASFSIYYGTQERGALVDISLSEDNKVGGMALKLVAAGY